MTARGETEITHCQTSWLDAAPSSSTASGGNCCRGADSRSSCHCFAGLLCQTGLSQTLEAPSVSPGPGKHALEQRQGSWDAPRVCHKCWIKRMQTPTSLILVRDGKSTQHEPWSQRKSVAGKVWSAPWLWLNSKDGGNRNTRSRDDVQPTHHWQRNSRRVKRHLQRQQENNDLSPPALILTSGTSSVFQIRQSR